LAVAIVSISRIQVRRGRKNQGSGLPQLASGEFGWAIDAQELYIGNGSVAEGAPYVGNTRILTESDDLFSLVENYQYKREDPFIQTGENENSPVLRTLQERLDERISIRSYGAEGDGSDQTQQIQRAIFNLFLNPATKNNPKSRAVLWLDPGVYRISSTIFLPPFVNIHGAGSEKTVIEYTGTDAAFETVNSTYLNSTPEFDSSLNQSRHNHISGLTVNLENKSVAFRLRNCRNSMFSDIALSGTWESGDDGFADSAFEFINLSKVVSCHSNSFENITVKKFTYVVFAKGDIYNNLWNNCVFSKSQYGVVFGKDAVIGSVGQTVGPANNSIKNSVFDDIERHGIWVANGKYNASINNKYYDVGNSGGSSLTAEFSVIQFEDSSNISENDWFKRTTELAYDQGFLTEPYIPEVSSNAFVDLSYTNKISVSQYTQSTRFFRLPVDKTTGYEIEYLYVSRVHDASRQGTMRLIVNTGSSVLTARKQLTDDYEYAGDPSWAEDLKFTAEIFDENGDGIVDTAAIMIVNSLLNDNADFYYRVKIK
jgi:hypothetical protein